MKRLQLSKDLCWTGVLDRDLRVFDIIMETEFGTTYNSYLLQGSEKTVLFETAKKKFDETYQEMIDGASVDYIVISHTEPDHVGCLSQILDRYPEAEVIATPVALIYLKEILNRDFKGIPAKKDMELSLGNKTLRFYPLPNLHWPDTMYTYIVEEKALVTCDSFGAHYAHEGILRSTVTAEEDYLSAVKYYFDMILGPFKHPFMTKALDLVRSLEVDLICTGHGPVLDSHIPALLDLYEEWCQVPVKEKKSVVIAYVSAYGYTESMAELIGEELKKTTDFEVLLFNLEQASEEEVVKAMEEADGLLFGSPTILQTALKPVLDMINHMTVVTHRGKWASAFGSYGWTGEAVPMVTERLAQLKLKVLDGCAIRFQPSGKEKEEIQAFAREFATKMTS